VIRLKEIVKDAYVVKGYKQEDMDSCVYMIDTKSDDGLILIDAGLYLAPIQAIEKEGFRIKDIKHCLLTHGHLDHFGVCGKLKKLNEEIKFYAHEYDIEKIEQKQDEGSIRLYYGDYEFNTIKITNPIRKDNEILKIGPYNFRCIHIPGHTSGSVAYLLEIEKKKVLFAGDVPGLVLKSRGGNLENYINSIQKLLSLRVDIMCEGHEDIIQPAEKVSKFLNNYIEFNKNIHIIVEVDPKNLTAIRTLTLEAYELEFYGNALELCNYWLKIDPNNQQAQKLMEKIKSHNPVESNFLEPLIKENFGG